MNNFVSLEPKQFPAYLEAIESAGAKVVPLGPEVRAMVWTDYANPQGLRDALQANPQLQWVQLNDVVERIDSGKGQLHPLQLRVCLQSIS